jgi:hypothetical protein
LFWQRVFASQLRTHFVRFTRRLLWKFAPFALYAVTLRESFLLEGDQSQTIENE